MQVLRADVQERLRQIAASKEVRPEPDTQQRRNGNGRGDVCRCGRRPREMLVVFENRHKTPEERARESLSQRFTYFTMQILRRYV